MQIKAAMVKDFPLFNGIDERHLENMLDCLGGRSQLYKKGQDIQLAFETISYIGVVLRGIVHMIKEDLYGNRTILVTMKRGDQFGETFACCDYIGSSVSFLSSGESEILLLPFAKVIHSCSSSCMFHHRLIENMFQLIADKNFHLMKKIEITSKKTLEEKIMTYLTMQAEEHQQPAFEIPLGRIELAEYLCADRSALTRELSSMKKKGLIDYHKNTFRIQKI